MSDPVRDLATRLTRVPGVAGAMVVDAEAGVPVASELSAGVNGTALAALAGSLFRRAGDSASGGGLGALRVLQLDAGGGHLVMAGAGALMVAALAAPDAQLGLVRVEVVRAAEALSR